MRKDAIIIEGAREHNLKNITVEIPRHQLTVVTGLSGSGKSSLAFDTLYAEGQRRYVESLSAYARQFLNQLQKPDVDHISGLSPAIAIEQRGSGANPRSIVATATEIHDYLRLLFANLGQAHCPACGHRVHRHSAQDIVSELMQWPDRTRVVLLAPVVKNVAGAHEEVLVRVRKQGFLRVRVNGTQYELDEVPQLAPRKRHSIEVVVDRLLVGSSVESRLTDSVELALLHGEGVVWVLREQGTEGWAEQMFSECNATCDLMFLARAIFHSTVPMGPARGVTAWVQSWSWIRR